MLVINQICLSSQSTDLSDSFKGWPFANIATKQIYECILISPVLQLISVSRWDSFEIDIPGEPGGAGQHVQGDHDDQQGHHGATGACGDEQNQNLDCADFADSKVSSIWLILIDIDHKGLIQSNPKERIRGLAEKLNGENQQLQVWSWSNWWEIIIKLMRIDENGQQFN